MCGCMVGSGNGPLLTGILPDGTCGSSRTLPGERRQSPLQRRSSWHNAGLLTRQRNLIPVLLASSRQVSWGSLHPSGKPLSLPCSFFCLEMRLARHSPSTTDDAHPGDEAGTASAPPSCCRHGTAHPSWICPASTQRCPPWEPPRWPK